MAVSYIKQLGHDLINTTKSTFIVILILKWSDSNRATEHVAQSAFGFLAD